MADAPFHAGDDGPQLQAPFLERALEAVLRLVEIYAAERHIQLRTHQAYRPDYPARGGDALAAASPADSLADARAPGRLTPSNARAGALGDEPGGRGDVATKSARRGWTRGNSTSAQIRTETADFLRQKGSRARGSEIWAALKVRGVVINSKDPSAVVSSRIGRSPLFDHTYEGYGLREWANGGAGDRK